jgi:uncharacterized protein
MQQRTAWVPIVTYIVLVLLSTLFVEGRRLPLPDTFFPALVALAVCLLFPQRKASFRQLGLGRLGQLRWYGLALLLPTVPIVLSYLVAWMVGLVALPTHRTPTPSLLALMASTLLLVLGILFLALGEELGWRGFLQPRASQVLGLKGALLLTGAVWAIWHYGFIIWGGYYSEGNLLLNLALFSVTAVLFSMVIGWIRAQSQSLWPAVLFHGMSNTVWSLCNTFFALKQPGWVYVAGEAGMVNLLIWAAVAIWVWRHLPARRSDESVQDTVIEAKALPRAAAAQEE